MSEIMVNKVYIEQWRDLPVIHFELNQKVEIMGKLTRHFGYVVSEAHAYQIVDGLVKLLDKGSLASGLDGSKIIVPGNMV